MSKESFDLSIHLGPGVAQLKPSENKKTLTDGENKKEGKRSVKKDEDDPREDVECSCKLCFGIGGSILIALGLLTILILYLGCLFEHQRGDQCYYRQPTVETPNFAKTRGQRN